MTILFFEFFRQNLDTVLKYSFLGSPLKILPCEFFLMEQKCIFYLSSHTTKS